LRNTAVDYVGKHDTWGNIWSYERGNARRLIELHNEELHDLYILPGNLRLIMTRRMKAVGHAASYE
jgi:hypothetical protein